MNDIQHGEAQMRQIRTLTITSLIAVLLFSLHFADDIARGIEQGDLFDYIGVLIMALWLYATLAMAERRCGLVIILLFSIAAAGVPLIHMRGAGLAGGRIANSSGVILWVWTLIALGTTGLVAIILSARALWHLQQGRPHARTLKEPFEGTR